MIRLLSVVLTLGLTGLLSVHNALGQEAAEATDRAASTEGAASTDKGRRIYVVPMYGQFGTDIHPDVYAPIIEDIKEVKPDTILFKLRTKALSGNEGFVDIIEGSRTREPNSDNTDYNMVRDLRRQFGIELDDYDQMLWVENANGILGIMAFGWDDMVMSPSATIGDLAIWYRMMRAAARGENVFGKYFDAMLGIMEGVAERGGWTHPERQPLWEAMTDPRQSLSTTWVGRKAIFYPTLQGEFVLDGSPEYPPTILSLSADEAEDLLVTKGVVNDMDDVALLMGWPRFEIVGDASDVTKEHRDDWRSLLDRAKGAMQAFQEGRRAGDLQGLSTCIRALRRLQSIERSNCAMTMAYRQNGIPSGVQLKVLIDQLEDQIEDMRRNGGGRRGPGGGGFGPGGGGGFGPGGPRPGG
ncbi:MAG: hypothetical protein MK101_10925 [Phycisphaerales bacterium]|nr:hypothetical protein [Phycisphaerales bacterium]